MHLRSRTVFATDERPRELVRDSAGGPARQPADPAAWRRTTPAERKLLLATIVLLPLENHIPSIAGFSALFIVFAAVAAYVVVNRAHILNLTWLHPVFLASYIFLIVASLLESAHPNSLYGDIVRFGFAICGAVLVATLCRERSALRAGLYGYVGTGLWLSVVLFSTSYQTLRGASVTDFQAATETRAEVFENNPVHINLNNMALMAAQGGIVALAFALASQSMPVRSVFLVVAAFCLLSSFLTMSRGGAAIILVSCSAVLYAHGLKHGKTMLSAAILGAIVFAALPESIWSRMAYSTEAQDGKVEARAKLYTAAITNLPDYIAAGVGAGHYWKRWGREHGFTSRASHSIAVLGAHNSFLQLTIYWGLVGLVAFLAIVWQASRCLPPRTGRDGLALGMLGIAVSLGVWLCVTHNFYDKSFTLALGMLVGARRWVWPSGAA